MRVGGGDGEVNGGEVEEELEESGRGRWRRVGGRDKKNS